MDLTGWDVVLWIHLLAMALFVGGQLFLGIAVVPTYVAQGGQAGAAHEWMQPIARRFGWASLGALAVALITGSMMASHLDLWSELGDEREARPRRRRDRADVRPRVRRPRLEPAAAGR